MEIKTYLGILARRWWIILPAFALTLALTFLFTRNQPRIYETSTTMVMRPQTSFVQDERELVRLVDLLSQRVEINTTYAEVAESRLVKNLAIERLDLSSQERKNLFVRSKVIPGTNILQITVGGTNPLVLQEFADAVRAETRTYISRLYDVFELEPLDDARVPSEPIRPNVPLNLAVGALLGLTLGMTLAFLAEYFLMEPKLPVSFDIIDSATGVYNQKFFMTRLQQEMVRSQRNNYRLTLALIELSYSRTADQSTPAVLPDVQREAGVLLMENVRTEDVVARYEGVTFAVLFPDLTNQAVRSVLEEIQIKFSHLPMDRTGATQNGYLRGAIGVAAYEQDDIAADELVSHAVHALKLADRTAYGAMGIYFPERHAQQSGTQSVNPITPLSDHPTA